MRRFELAVDDVNQAIQRFHRTVGLRFRPSLTGGGSRDAHVGAQTVRLRPRRRGSGPAVIRLAAPVPEEQIVELLGCRWVLRPARRALLTSLSRALRGHTMSARSPTGRATVGAASARAATACVLPRGPRSATSEPSRS